VVSQLLQTVAQHLVVIPTQRVARDIGLLAVSQHGFGVSGGGRQIGQVNGDDRARSRHEFRRSGAFQAMPCHIIHAAVEPGREPRLQAGLGMAEIHAGNRGARETQFQRASLDFIRQFLKVEFCMHAADDTVFSAYLPDEAATANLGAAIARALQPGMSIWLEGNLGAGKTTLTRGILRGCGFTGRVKSPTYTLVEPYIISSLYLYHFDLYRFGDPLEWEDAGFRDYFNPESVCLIEWADKAEGLLPTPDWVIELSPESTGRRCRIIAHSALGKACQQHLDFE